MTAIRAYRDADAQALRALFARAGEGSPSGELWRHPDSERAVYLDPYIEHCADSLFVAEDGGEPVGYLTGCPAGAPLPSEEDRLIAALRRPSVLLRPATARFLGRAVFDLATVCRREPSASGELHDERWPAHLHIDVAPQARGTGAAYGLMDAWSAALDGAGCHLQTLVENTRAVRFFERCGFVPYGPSPTVPGVRHRGARVHQLTMVRPHSTA
ncbi:GCN5 family acetyltransferase [Tsukamurella pulmonis]|uniref:Acetyltransferase (GNAT) family protein n=1 Tax=Tsukamurella pulmonis TaxID=47312 RepID=A0A1H1G9C3_9ACTN|nr:GNAT family N-acetyltransferase [Tsukamurella pulmonis]KXO87899.1 GCN5 family acetyltransferase [Tsukamurella pulmonis]SDR09791.1 Acetyltransferase (GNAT) family protein [Tsukamurella pulmonis]SUP17629.1 Acetyltransferase (GNAT) family [Tsukamurella pulmonis]